MTRVEMIKQVANDMQGYWGILCSAFGIHPEFDVMSAAHATSVRAVDLINSGLLSRAEALETAIVSAQQTAENCFVATTTHIIKGGDKFEYNSRVVFNLEILEIMLTLDDIPKVLEYLKLMMHHEFGHCIVYANLAKQCKTTSAFVKKLDERSEVYAEEYNRFEEYAKNNKTLKDALVYYHTNISEEHEANAAMNVNISRLADLDVKFKEMMDSTTQKIPSIKDVVIKK